MTSNTSPATVSVTLTDGRKFKGQISWDIQYAFKTYKLVDPITGKFIVNKLPSLDEGSVVEFKSVSGGYREDSKGNRWPAYFRFSPLTGEKL